MSSVTMVDDFTVMKALEGQLLGYKLPHCSMDVGKMMQQGIAEICEATCMLV